MGEASKPSSQITKTIKPRAPPSPHVGLLCPGTRGWGRRERGACRVWGRGSPRPGVPFGGLAPDWGGGQAPVWGREGGRGTLAGEARTLRLESVAGSQEADKEGARRAERTGLSGLQQG